MGKGWEIRGQGRKFVGKVGTSWARWEIRGQGREIRGQGREFVGKVGKFVGKVGNSWARSGNSWARSEIPGQGRKFLGKVGNSWARSEIRGQGRLPTNFRPCPRISDLAQEFPTLPTNFPTLPTNFPTLPTNFRPCPRISRPCPRISRPCPRISLAFKLLCEGEGLGFRARSGAKFGEVDQPRIVGPLGVSHVGVLPCTSLNCCVPRHFSIPLGKATDTSPCTTSA